MCGALFMTICARKMLSDSQLVPTTVDSPRTSVSLPLHHFSSSPNTTLCTKEFLKLSFFVTCSSSWFEWAQTWFDLIWIDLTWLDLTQFDLTWLNLTQLEFSAFKNFFGTQCNDGNILCNTLCANNDNLCAICRIKKF